MNKSSILVSTIVCIFCLGNSPIQAAQQLMPHGVAKKSPRKELQQSILQDPINQVIQLWKDKAGTIPDDFYDTNEYITQIKALNKGMVVIGCYNGDIYVVNLYTESKTLLPQAHTKRINSFYVQAGGQKFISGSADGYVRLWDVRRKKNLVSYLYSDPVVDLVLYKPNVCKVIDDNRNIFLWNFQTGLSAPLEVPKLIEVSEEFLLTDFEAEEFSQRDSFESSKQEDLHAISLINDDGKLADEKHQHRCPLCQKCIQGTPYNLRVHIQLHYKDKELTCLQCGKKIPDAAKFKLHMKDHQGQNYFPCKHTDCDMFFTSEAGLKAHITDKHTNKSSDLKAKTCSLCGKVFSSPATCKRHLKTHSKETTHASAVATSISNSNDVHLDSFESSILPDLSGVNVDEFFV